MEMQQTGCLYGIARLNGVHNLSRACVHVHFLKSEGVAEGGAAGVSGFATPNE